MWSFWYIRRYFLLLLNFLRLYCTIYHFTFTVFVDLLFITIYPTINNLFYLFIFHWLLNYCIFLLLSLCTHYLRDKMIPSSWCEFFWLFILLPLIIYFIVRKMIFLVNCEIKMREKSVFIDCVTKIDKKSCLFGIKYKTKPGIMFCRVSFRVLYFTLNRIISNRERQRGTFSMYLTDSTFFKGKYSRKPN